MLFGEQIIKILINFILKQFLYIYKNIFKK
jgi:hypothetical protein